jgi:hypothetical protein
MESKLGKKLNFKPDHHAQDRTISRLLHHGFKQKYLSPE